MRFPNVRFLLAFLVWCCLSSPCYCQDRFPTPDIALPAFSEWTTGGKLDVIHTPTGFRLSVPSDGDWGHVWVEGEIDIDATPYVAVWVTEVGHDAQWGLGANGDEIKTLEPAAEDVGLAVYDLREKTGWHGRKRFRFYLTVIGKGHYIEVARAGLFRNNPAPADRPARWTRMNGSTTPYSPLTGTIPLTMTDATADQWGGLATKFPLNVDKYPFVEATVTDLAPDARWRVALASAAIASGPEQRNNGTVAFNYRDLYTWRGITNVDLQVIFLKVGGSTAGTLRSLRFVPYPTASSALVQIARGLGSPVGKPLLTTGAFQLSYDRSAQVFRIERPGGRAALVSRFLEMPGFDIAPTTPPVAEKTPTGQRIRYTRASNGASFTVTTETLTGSPGLLHTRVTVTPTKDIRLASCGHEWAYAPFSGGADSKLHQWTIQNHSAAPLAYLSAPDVGRLLYWQNLTALNPLFNACGMSPRFLVSAGDSTFGFANPLDTEHRFKAGETTVLSDSYLYLAAETVPTTDPVAVADGLIKGMAAAYNALPDKPQTHWVDWHGLAEQSLHDLLSGDCWRDYNGKPYLQSYVGVRGSSPQLAGTQDVYAPLLNYHPTTPQGVADRETILSRFRSTLPTFWSPERGTFREAAMPGDHIWYNIPFSVTLARVGLAGDKEARELCLKSAPALMRLAAETHDTFRRADLQTQSETPGTYILYMMQCYAMDPQPKYLEEAKRVAKTLSTWTLDGTHEIYWTAMTCEGLARLYSVTKDRAYVRTSLIPLARVLRNTWFWESDYGLAKDWSTFAGLLADATGIDYIAPMEQHQSWYSLREYYRLTEDVLPSYAALMIGELIRYIPMTVWDTYPAHLPPASLHQGEAFWKTDNNYALAIPVEDITSGWVKNGAVGQELYGAGACFAMVNEQYQNIPEAGCTVFSEYPVLSSTWDAKANTFTVRLGGSARYQSKIEIRGRKGTIQVFAAPRETPTIQKPLAITTISDDCFRLEAPGDSVLHIRFVTASPVK